MRFDKFTTKLQEALAQAQSLALGQDNQYIEPQHLLAALLEDEGIAGLIAKAGGNPNALKKAWRSDFQASQGGRHARQVHLSRELAQLLNVADKEAQKRGDQYIASELFLLAAAGDKGETGRPQAIRRHQVGAGESDPGSARRRKRFFSTGRRAKAGAGQIHP